MTQGIGEKGRPKDGADIERSAYGGEEPELGTADVLVAVDLDRRAPADAVERGERARADLGRELLRLGAARFSAGDHDDLAELVPEYVTLPRGVAVASGEVAWSRGPR